MDPNLTPRLEDRLDFGRMAVARGLIWTDDPAAYRMMRALVRLCAAFARSHLHIDDRAVELDDACLEEGEQSQDRYGGVTASRRDEGRLTNRVSIQLREPVHESAQQLGPRVRSVVPFVERRIG